MANRATIALLKQVIAHLEQADSDSPATLPELAALRAAERTLPEGASTSLDLPSHSEAATLAHLLSDIVPALNGQASSGRYYGFVTGGALPIAQAADLLATVYDQNVQVHLPDQTVATAVEDAALRMVISLLRLDGDAPSASGDEKAGRGWTGRTLTTGCTASNILGLACGREHVLSAARSDEVGNDNAAFASDTGLAGIGATPTVRVLTTLPHSSLYKAASIVGIGRQQVLHVASEVGGPWRLDVDQVEKMLTAEGDRNPHAGIIISVSAGEVNTGRFATGYEDMRRLRELADRHGAWIHVDGAFGIFARALPQTPEFASLHEQASGLELADSIAFDAHKLLNVPYDSGVFLTRHPDVLGRVFQNPSAAYLSSSSKSTILSPLNIGIENSRRFRALPAYAALHQLGREGFADIFARQVRLARKIANFIAASDVYELLPETKREGDGQRGLGGRGAQRIRDHDSHTHIIVLFRPIDPALQESIVERINNSREMYVSGTTWDSVLVAEAEGMEQAARWVREEPRRAVRIAVASWRVDVERDFAIVKRVLIEAASFERNFRSS